MEERREDDERESGSGSPSLEIARSAYGDMLHDTERNALYELGVKWAIETLRARGEQDIVVLDIGTGSGLLSMLAARHGADTIYACDAFEPVIEVARKVISSNGYEKKVKLIPKASFDVTVGRGCDMETRAHILVTELFDTELVGEGAIRAYHDARERLLSDGCLIVPQEATVFVQVVDSAFLRRHHAPDTDGLSVTEEMKECLGTASLHDIQLSQLEPGVDLNFVTDPVEVFHFDFKDVLRTRSQVDVDLREDWSRENACVLMWWQCRMSPEVILSCAPFWAHPDGRNQPWRDHWMQAVYYPRNTRGRYLSCRRDEFSFWFDITDTKGSRVEMPVCTCGVHFTVPRSRIAQVGAKSYIATLRRALEATRENEILFIGQSLLTLPLVLAKQVPHKNFTVLDTGSRSSKILEQLIDLNKLGNCRVFTDTHNIQLLFAEPYFNECLLPWDPWLRLQDSLGESKELSALKRLPAQHRIMYMSVELEHLWKIRAPIKATVGLKMEAYDDFIQLAISSCDSDVEPQPLWEYPCRAESDARVDVSAFELCVPRPCGSNGIALWSEYDFGGISVSTGPVCVPHLGEKVVWNRYVKQGIIIDVDNKPKFSITF
ncbi:protein arginine N-methyltransferase 7 [Galendromus occidentalis]|uniref:Protein arginine N-methyltransferase 7 n=1 Tax=Galendromus occidentalis TaxID=34638 RepID=A0AAJ7SH70_9ACAR|nr:protein arginine N-methyltransferase 7 [Galendromus occidentalis]